MNSRDMVSLVPNPDELLRFPKEEQGRLILRLLRDYNSPQKTIKHSNFFTRANDYLEKLNRANDYMDGPKYENRQKEVDSALMVAWNWLEHRCLLVKAPSSNGDWFFVSEEGQRLASEVDASAYKNVSLLSRNQLHSVISEKVYLTFLHGKYGTAIFEAFREVEIAVREAAKLPAELVGERLMRAAFQSAKSGQPGPLTDVTLPFGEQEAMGHLFAGAFGLYRNSNAHRDVPTNPEEAGEIIVLASQLLRIVDRLKPPPSRIAP